MQKMDERERIEQKKRLKERMLKIKYKFVVISGKGGVGKSTVAVNLAYGLAVKGNKVGILDVDIHGPNVAKMLGIEGKRLIGSESGIEPMEVLPNLKAVNLALFFENKDQPIIWRGPLKMITIKQFLADVKWGELDYLIVDSPPGTGDEPLSVCQLIPNINGAIVVTTPQDMAILDSRKSVLFAKELKVPVLGIIENMSGFICPHCGNEMDIFKWGGGEKAAQELRVPFLGRVPFQPEFVEYADKGTPFVSFQEKSKSAEAFMAIVSKVKEFVGDKK